jgi:hypothetical protein
MKIWLTTTALRERGWLENTQMLLDVAKRNLERAPTKRFTLASSPDRADAIVYIEAEYSKLRSYYELLFSEELVQRHSNRYFVYDCADTSWGLAPGVYPHLRAHQQDPSRFRSGGFLRMYNQGLEELYDAGRGHAPRLLASFRGNDTSATALRSRILALRSTPGIALTRITKWFNHTEDEKRAYIAEMHDSKFVLCPRGLGPATYRVYEAMQLARVPVILSDDWVPPFGPAWPDFAIRIAESRVDEVLEVIASHEAHAAEMGAAARRAWEQWFAPDIVFYRALQAIESICLERPNDYAETMHRHWRSLRVQWKLGWTPPQRLVLTVRQGKLIERAKRRIERLMGHTPPSGGRMASRRP